ncbi:MAG: tetratricopeptide repeat protein [Bacteroidota bacterium]
MRDQNVDIRTIPKRSGDYYLNVNFNETIRYVRNMDFPENIPILNIFPENSFPGFPEILSMRWRKLHEEFGDNANTVTNIIAKGSGHAIFQDNPALIIHAISKAYAKTLDEAQQNALLQKALDNAIVLAIEAKVNMRSEQDLNALGYSFLGNEAVDNALEVFKVATILFPDSFTAYDSYGEALLKANRKAEAIEMYEKSIELNPKNENAKEVLLQLKQN